MISRGLTIVSRHISCRGNFLNSIGLQCHQHPASQVGHQKIHHHVASSTILASDCNRYKRQDRDLFPSSSSMRCLHQSLVSMQKSQSPDNTPATDTGSKTSPEGQLAVDEDEDEDAPIIPTTDETGKPMSNWARMKFVMKTYGYVVIPVHWVIAPVWFGSFYYAIKMGVDIEPMLTKVGVSDHHIETLKNSRASTALMAYALYKIFTPLRYTLTLGATEFTIRSLRKRGFIKPTPPKEKTYRQSIKDTADAVRERAEKHRQSQKDK